MANPAELEGRLMSRPLLCGRPPGELGALLARSWLTVVNDGGGGRLSRSKRSTGAPLPGTVLGSDKTAFGVETWRVSRDWLRRRGSWESAARGWLVEVVGELDAEFWSLCDPSEKRDEMRFADLTGADNILCQRVGRVVKVREQRWRAGRAEGGGQALPRMERGMRWG